VEVEKTTRGQAEPSEEVQQALKTLWLIAIRFTMNFHSTKDGYLYQIDRTGLWKRLLNLILRRIGYSNSVVSEFQYRPHRSRKSFKTLEDLENEFVAAIANLERQQGATQADLQASRDRESKEFLRTIHRFDKNLSLACLFRMCMISTPVRSPMTSQDIIDMFATMTSRLVSVGLYLFIALEARLTMSRYPGVAYSKIGNSKPCLSDLRGSRGFANSQGHFIKSKGCY
jgi:hypothetical protein